MVKLFGHRYLAHHLIWLIVTGEWPTQQIDHRNNKPDDNRWRNLRAATDSQNRMNSKVRINNTSGYKGVYLNRARGKYCATITANGVTTWLGSYDTAEAAARAYREAAQEIHGEYARIA